MIASIANLLRDLMLKESDKLDQEGITHPPTIGAMYEGLTRDILDRTIPPSLDLRVVDGFIEGADGALSPQIDAMLVAGSGRELPYGVGHVWPINKVLAVLEVKKNLFGADLEDAFVKLRTVMHMQNDYLWSKSGPDATISPAFHAFALLTGLFPRNGRAVNDLPEEFSYILHALVSEQLAPVRIIIGYHGYADEFSLRKGLIGYIEANFMSAGFGVTSFPNLIVCRNNALVKLNGFPYIGPSEGPWWPFLASNAENPLRILIELVWARLSNEFGASLPADDTLQMERLAPFLSAHLARCGGKPGWEYRFHSMKRKQLASIEPWKWEPGPIDEIEWTLLMLVASQGELDVLNQEHRQYVAKKGFDFDALVKGLIERRMLAWCDDHTVRLISDDTLYTVVLPDGRTMTASQADLLQLWLKERLVAERDS